MKNKLKSLLNCNGIRFDFNKSNMNPPEKFKSVFGFITFQKNNPTKENDFRSDMK